jgi:hypothetical protein
VTTPRQRKRFGAIVALIYAAMLADAEKDALESFEQAVDGL